MKLPLRLPRATALVAAAALVACGSSPPGAGPVDGGGGNGDDSSANGADANGSDANGGDASGSDAGGVDAGPGVDSTACTVTAGTSGTLLTGTVLLPAGPTTGELLVDATGTIVCAAASCASSAGYAAATKIACPTSVISPSLVNAHDHTEYAVAPPLSLGTTRYECRSEWRTGANGATKLSYPAYTTDTATLAAQELRFVLGGAAAVLGSSGVGGLARNLADFSAPQNLESGLAGAVAYFDVFPLGDKNGMVLTSGCGYPSITPVASAFSTGQYAPHVSEGINADAENELTCTSGAGLITARTSVIHGVGLNATDIDVVAKAGAKLIWSPRSNIELYGDTARVTTYAAEGVPIAMGTDWLLSGSMNMLRELNCADTFNTTYMGKAFTDQQLFEMATINGAVASAFDSQTGSLAAGKTADVTVFEASVNAGYRAVIAAGAEDVHLVMRGGKILYGEAPIVSAVNAVPAADSGATSCGALNVCGFARTACIDTPGVTLAQIEASAASVYPLFFCKGQAPTAEPSCTPYRSDYANGVTAIDADGDGVADATDLCPHVFDPARPMDNGKQSDVDGDGVGDACDAQPLNAAAH